MAKEKVSEKEIKNKEFIFLYEIIGVSCILVSLISIFRLGLLGKYGMLTFRLLFGDWYFLFIALLAFLGFYFLFMHHKLEFNSIRYIGIILILISLIILSHFSMHNFVSKYDTNAFTTTISLYLDYFKNNRNDMMIGGGLVGCLLFYLLFFLLSKIGTILVCFILIFLGIVFLTKRTIIDFFKMLKRLFGRCFGGAFSITKRIKDKIVIYNNEYKVEEKDNKKLKFKYLKEERINQDIDYKNADELISRIKNCLNYLNIFYSDVTYIVSHHITVYFISTFQDVNYEVLRLTLSKIIKKEILIRFDEINHIIIIEVNNEICYPLSFTEAIKNSDKKNPKIMIGLDDRNQYVTVNESMVIISNKSICYKYYFASLILFPYFLNNIHDKNIILIDLNKNFSHLKNNVNEYYDHINSIEDIKKELDELLVNLQEEGCSKIDEYNKTHKDKIKNKIVYINGLENIINNFEYNKYLEYFILSGTNVGYIFILGCTENISENNIILRALNYKIFLYNNFKFTEKYLGHNIIEKINKNNEGILKYRDLTIRISLLMIKKEEIEKVTSK